jgi:lipopolysaccharide/colanic/teichoic acid biosynthesis glycosyltransferase
MILKWIFDRVISLLGLLILWPVLLVVAILVKIKMPGGPVLFVQKRVGKDGKLFKCHKFRTMRVHHNGSTVSVAGDSRITPLGAKLRKYKLDELPELWNVLIGDMSFVGPRPEVPKYVEMYNEEQRKVLSVRPGITDYASIEYRNENDILAKSDNPEQTYIDEVMPAKLKLNLQYINDMSLCVDVKIIFKTFFKIFD